MGWPEYYRRTEIRSFLQEAMPFFRKNLPKAAEEDEIAILGGFHPHSMSIWAFQDLCQQKGYLPLVVDKNDTPFTIRRNFYGRELDQMMVQTDLTNLPLAPKTVRAIFLDSTTIFMSDDELLAAAQEAARVLKPHGQLIIMVDDVIWKSIFQLLSRWINHYPVKIRNVRQLTDIIEKSELKINYNCYYSQENSYAPPFNILSFSPLG